jgi:SAM-dependent methyltransferase
MEMIRSQYGVNPWVFIGIYLATFVPCWYAVFRILAALKRKDKRSVLTWVCIEVILLLAPYLYVLAVGRNLPRWFYPVLGVAVALTLWEGIHFVRRARSASTEKSRLLWNLYALPYAMAVRHSIPHQAMFADVVRALDLSAGARLLDAGCGAGYLETYLLDRSLDVDVAALDFSPKMVATARKVCSGSGRMQFTQTDLDQPLPYPDAHFDRVACVSVLFALPRPEFTLGELVRVLKPGGKLVLVEPRPGADIGRSVFLAQVQAIRQHKGSEKIKVCLKMIAALPLGMVLYALNRIIDGWIVRGEYHAFSLAELEDDLRRAGATVVARSLTLADQDNLVVAGKPQVLLDKQARNA